MPLILFFFVVGLKRPQTGAQMLTIAWCQQFCVCVFFFPFFLLPRTVCECSVLYYSVAPIYV